MSRKHYREVADILSKSKNKGHWSFETVIDDLCIMFKRDNTNFKPEVFKEACGL